MKRKHIYKIAVLLIFVIGFISTGLYFYSTIVKKYSFKPDQFKNAE